MLLRHIVLASGLLASPLSALGHRSYNPSIHDRFLNFSTAPAANPNFIWSGLDLTGIGWDQAPNLQYALVSRRHVVFATHFAQPTPRIMSFLNAAGTVVTVQIQSKVIVQDGGVNSDLTLLTLASPIDEGSGISPLPYLDLPAASSYRNLTIGVIGRPGTGVPSPQPVGGRAVIANVETTPRTVATSNTTLNPTVYMRFDFRSTGSDSSNVYFQSGDSGSPTFVESGGRAALVGTHSYVGTGLGQVLAENYDTFLPYYVPQLDALMGPLGYRMRPVNAPATTLSGTAAAVETPPRRLKPLTLEFDLANTGANLTGNLEVEFQFPAGQEPDSVSAAGWVTSGSGAKWTLRKATLAPAGAETLSAVWAAAPALAALTPTLVWRSDTVADQSISPVISLEPSYAEWSAGLSAPGESEDPDEDGLVNLVEYALGGDAASGVLRNANGGPLAPALTQAGGNVSLVFPERSDAAARGLGYTVWYSPDLSEWTAAVPVGASSGTAPHVPAIPGFVERTITWPDSAAARFVRVEIRLDE